MRAKRNKDGFINSFEDLYFFVAGADSQVAQVLTGNLAVEFLLRKLLSQYDANLGPLSHDLSHAKLINLSQDTRAISESLASLLREANSLRNRFAHHFGYTAELEELINLCRHALEATSDYAEMVGGALEKVLATGTSHEVEKWTLAEIFLAIVYDLHQRFLQNGGDEEQLRGN